MEGGDLLSRRSGFFSIVVLHVIGVVKCGPHLHKVYGKRRTERKVSYIVVLMALITRSPIMCSRRAKWQLAVSVTFFIQLAKTPGGGA